MKLNLHLINISLHFNSLAWLFLLHEGVVEQERISCLLLNCILSGIAILQLLLLVAILRGINLVPALDSECLLDILVAFLVAEGALELVGVNLLCYQFLFNPCDLLQRPAWLVWTSGCCRREMVVLILALAPHSSVRLQMYASRGFAACQLKVRHRPSLQSSGHVQVVLLILQFVDPSLFDLRGYVHFN